MEVSTCCWTSKNLREGHDLGGKLSSLRTHIDCIHWVVRPSVRSAPCDRYLRLFLPSRVTCFDPHKQSRTHFLKVHLFGKSFPNNCLHVDRHQKQ